jgi:hypothetical protein
MCGGTLVKSTDVWFINIGLEFYYHRHILQLLQIVVKFNDVKLPVYLIIEINAKLSGRILVSRTCL